MKISIDDQKFVWIVVLVLAFVFRKPLVATLLPFILALALAALIEPFVNLVQRRLNAPRPVAAASGLALLVVSGGYVYLLVFFKVLSELVQMGSLLKRYQSVPVDLAALLISSLNKLNEIVDQRGLPQAVQDNILATVRNVTETGIALATQGINLVIGAVSQVPALVVISVITLIATYFLVKDRDQLVESALSIAPDPVRERIRDVQKRVVVDLLGFFKAQLILVGMTTFVVAIGLIIIGVDYWMTLALMAGILDLVPVLGPGFLFVPWAVGALTLGQSALALKVLVLFTVAFLIRQVFQAKILGDSIGIHPLVMLLALYAGIHFFGIQGFIIAPVIVIVVKALLALRVRA